MTAEISWTHNVVILEKCKDPLEREFYIRMSKRHGWTYRVLMNQISNKTYEKTMLTQTNFDKSLPEKIKPEAKLSMKDDYAFDFLELADEHTEHELERAILSRVEDFLREMGHVFSFMGSQYRLEVGDQEFKIDILLFHRKLRSLIAVELKIGTFVPEHIGKMQFYLSVLDARVRLEGENPSIGIIMCKSKNRTIVEYALKDATKPINSNKEFAFFICWLMANPENIRNVSFKKYRARITPRFICSTEISAAFGSSTVVKTAAILNACSPDFEAKERIVEYFPGTFLKFNFMIIVYPYCLSCRTTFQCFRSQLIFWGELSSIGRRLSKRLSII